MEVKRDGQRERGIMREGRGKGKGKRTRKIENLMMSRETSGLGIRNRREKRGVLEREKGE